MGRSTLDRRRVWILLVVFLSVVGAGAAFVVVRKARIERRYQGQRDEGVAAWRQERYEEAIAKLPGYLKRAPDDKEAWYAFAESRRRLPVVDGTHLDLALRAYAQFLSLEPNHSESLRQSMLIRAGRRQYTEAADLARQLLAVVPGDAEGLRVKAMVAAMLNRDAAALKACNEALAVSPLDLDLHVVSLDLRRHLGQRAEAIEHARRMLEKHPDQGVSELVAGIALADSDGSAPEELNNLIALLRQRYPNAPGGELPAGSWAQFLVDQAAQRKAPDASYVLRVVATLDRVQRPLASIAVLERAIQDGLSSSVLRQELVLRLFDAHHFADLEQRWAGLEVPATSWGVNLIGMRAMVLTSLGREEAKGAIAELAKAAANDQVAAGWHIAARAAAGERVSLHQQIAVLTSAVEAGRNHPYLLYFLGEAQAAIGEPEMAVDAMRKATAQRPFWALAHARLARLLAERQEVEESKRYVARALNLTRAAYLLANLASTVAAVVPEGTLSQVETVANVVAEIQKVIPYEEQTLPLHVAILAQSNRREEAVKVVRDILAIEKPSQSLLLRLAAVCENMQLGSDEELLARAEKIYGQSAPILSARAQRLRRSGMEAQGAALLEEAIKGGTASREAKLAWARYLETSQDARAKAAWAMLADDPALKDDLTVQRAAMDASSVRSDRALLARTIERVRALTGDKAVAWRMAKARLLAAEDAKPEDLTEAARLLDGIIADAPTQAEPRVMLATVHERSGNTSKAIEQYQLAIANHENADLVRLQLARLYTLDSDLARAREQAEAVRSERLDASGKRRLAAIYARLGETARAAALIEGLPDVPGIAGDDLLLAELSWRQGNLERAETIYRRLLEKPDVITVRAAVMYYASTGRKAQAEQLLAGSESMKLPIAAREMMRGQYHAVHGQPPAALEHFRAAVAANRSDVGAWKALITQQFRLGRVEDAISSAASAAQAHPADVGLRTFLENASLLRSHNTTSAVAAVVLSLIQSADIGATQEVLRIVDEATRQGLPAGAIAGKLRPLADRAQRIVPIQVLLVHYYMQEQRLEEAASIISRAAKNAPATPELAELAAKVHLTAKDYSQALSEAGRWRQLTSGQPLPADLMISEIHLRAGDAPAALRQIEPYLKDAITNPDAAPGVVIQRAKIALTSGQLGEAQSLLAAPAKSSPQWRAAWLELTDVLLSNPKQAAEWLKGAETVIPETAANERITLAHAWARLGHAGSDAAYTGTAVRMLSDLAPRVEKAGPVFYALAIVESQAGNTSGAEAAYRKCLEHDAAHAVAKNNLSLILMERKETLAEALKLAGEAVAAMPKLATFHDSLAQVQAKARQFDAAIATMTRAIELEPQNVEWRLTLAEICADAGQTAQLEKAIQQIESMLQGRTGFGNMRTRLLKLKLRVPAKTADNR